VEAVATAVVGVTAAAGCQAVVVGVAVGKGDQERMVATQGLGSTASAAVKASKAEYIDSKVKAKSII